LFQTKRLRVEESFFADIGFSREHRYIYVKSIYLWVTDKLTRETGVVVMVVEYLLIIHRLSETAKARASSLGPLREGSS
jgi:hypothetical protein